MARRNTWTCDRCGADITGELVASVVAKVYHGPEYEERRPESPIFPGYRQGPESEIDVENEELCLCCFTEKYPQLCRRAADKVTALVVKSSKS